MTPDEERKIERKERKAVWISVLIAIPIVLIGIVFLSAVDDDESDSEILAYVFTFVTLIVSSYLIGRIYRKHLERKLGRPLKNEYELTSLKSWMDVSTKDKAEKLEKDVTRKTDKV